MTERTNHVVHDSEADSSGPTSARVIRCVSVVTGRDPLDLPPLYDVVDPDALDTLVSRDGDACTLSFEFAGAHVRVSGTGDIHVSPAGDE